MKKSLKKPASFHNFFNHKCITNDLPIIALVSIYTIDLQQLKYFVPAQITLAGLLPQIETALVADACMAAVREDAVRQVGVTHDAFWRQRTR